MVALPLGPTTLHTRRKTMPFDNPNYPHQRLFDLEEKLRKKDFQFEWDFNLFSHCAAAIDCKVNESEPAPTYKYLAEYYGITLDESKGIFSSCWNWHGKNFTEVTPDDVAKTVRKVLKVYTYANIRKVLKAYTYANR